MGMVSLKVIVINAVQRGMILQSGKENHFLKFLVIMRPQNAVAFISLCLPVFVTVNTCFIHLLSPSKPNFVLGHF